MGFGHGKVAGGSGTAGARVGFGQLGVSRGGLWASGRSWGIRVRHGGCCWALHSKVITVPPVAGSLIVQGEECESFPVFGGGVYVSPKPCYCRTLCLSCPLEVVGHCRAR